MDYEIKNFTDKSVKEEKKSRKIKFKNISFLNILNRFTDFVNRKAENRLEQKLVSAKKNLTDSAFFDSDFKENSRNSSFAEEVVYKKSLAIARLEERLNILDNNGIDKIDVGEERAIKLKDKMMETLRKNTNAYGVHYVPKDQVADVFNVDAVTQEINEKLSNVTVEEAKNETNESDISNIEVNDVKDVVDKSFAEEVENKEVNESIPVESEVKENNEPEGKINFEDVNDIVNKELEQKEENIEVNEISPITPIERITTPEIPKIERATISNDISEKESINEDIFGKEETTTIEEKEPEEEKEERVVPIVVPDRDEVNYAEKTKDDIEKANELYNELTNTKIEDVEKQEELQKQIAEIDEEIEKDKENLTDEEINAIETEYSEKDKTEEVSKDIPKEENIGFDYSDATIEDIKKAAEVSMSPKDLTAMMQKVEMLRKEELRTQEQVNKAKAEEEEKTRQYEATFQKFVEYSNELEKRCNQNIEEKNAIVNKSKEKDDAINTMLAAMEKNEEKHEQKKR